MTAAGGRWQRDRAVFAGRLCDNIDGSAVTVEIDGDIRKLFFPMGIECDAVCASERIVFAADAGTAGLRGEPSEEIISVADGLGKLNVTVCLDIFG